MGTQRRHPDRRGIPEDYNKELEKEARRRKKAYTNKPACVSALASPKQLGEVYSIRCRSTPRQRRPKPVNTRPARRIAQTGQQRTRSWKTSLAFREFRKLRSTYVDALPLMINPKTGRVHTSYAQAVAVTGRLSSNRTHAEHPDPERSGPERSESIYTERQRSRIDFGRLPRSNCASWPPSAAMPICEAFRSGTDIHTATAAKSIWRC